MISDSVRKTTEKYKRLTEVYASVSDGVLDTTTLGIAKTEIFRIVSFEKS